MIFNHVLYQLSYLGLLVDRAGIEPAVRKPARDLQSPATPCGIRSVFWCNRKVTILLPLSYQLRPSPFGLCCKTIKWWTRWESNPRSRSYRLRAGWNQPTAPSGPRHNSLFGVRGGNRTHVAFQHKRICNPPRNHSATRTFYLNSRIFLLSLPSSRPTFRVYLEWLLADSFHVSTLENKKPSEDFSSWRVQTY